MFVSEDLLSRLAHTRVRTDFLSVEILPSDDRLDDKGGILVEDVAFIVLIRDNVVDVAELFVEEGVELVGVLSLYAPRYVVVGLADGEGSLDRSSR